MSVHAARSSLSVFGKTDSDTAAFVTRALGIEPDESREAGESMRGGRIAKQSGWFIEGGRSDATEEDPHGFASLDRVLERVGGRSEAWANLRDRYEIRVFISGDSDGGQNSLALTNEQLRAIADIGAYLWIDVYVDEEDD